MAAGYLDGAGLAMRVNTVNTEPAGKTVGGCQHRDRLRRNGGNTGTSSACGLRPCCLCYWETDCGTRGCPIDDPLLCCLTHEVRPWNRKSDPPMVFQHGRQRGASGRARRMLNVQSDASCVGARDCPSLGGLPHRELPCKEMKGGRRTAQVVVHPTTLNWDAPCKARATAVLVAPRRLKLAAVDWH